MIWCFSYNGTGELIVIEDTINVARYNQIFQDCLQTSVEKLELGPNWLFQQNNDPKHSVMATHTWFKTSNINLITWPSQSPGLNPIENL